MTNSYTTDVIPSTKASVWKPEQDAVCVPPTADFSVDLTTIEEGQTVQFTDTSTGNPMTSWAWDFGDGTTSNEQNPSHIYEEPGDYTVTLAATNACGADFEIKVDYIIVTACVVPIADFEADVVTGAIPLTVQFTSNSIGSLPRTYLWDFGDGETSTEENPTHIYATEDSFTVSLTVTNDCGEDTEEKADFIVTTESLPDLGALLVYALARLVEDYTGPLVRVRNTTTNVQTDIPYVVGTNLLDLDALEACAGVGGAEDLVVVTWYDQEAGGYHATNATGAQQPYIWQGGVFLGFIEFDGAGDVLTSPNVPYSAYVGTVVTDGTENATFVAGNYVWRFGGNFLAAGNEDFGTPWITYGVNNTYIIRVDTTNDDDATRIFVHDSTLNVNSNFQNEVYEDGVALSEIGTFGSNTNVISTGPVILFTSHAQMRAWLLLPEASDSDKRALLNSLVYGPTP